MMSRLGRAARPAPGCKCHHCGLNSGTVVELYFPDALPTDTYYGQCEFTHVDEEACVVELMKMKERLVEALRDLLCNEYAAEVAHEADLKGAFASASAALWVVARSRARALLAEIKEG